MDDNTLPPGAKRITREQYVEMLVESSMREADDLEEGFGAWSEKHAPTWHEMGHDEDWIRQRIESARATQNLHQTLKAKGYTREQRRQVLREMYTDTPELYDLMIARERLDPHISIIYGTTDDLVQRYTLRVMVYEADKTNYARFCRWAGIPEGVFEETSSLRFIRDLSTVEELEMALNLAQYLGQCLDDPTPLTSDEISQMMEDHGGYLRQHFIAKYRYKPEESTTPHIPVTIDGPADPEEYHRQHRTD